MPGQGGAPWGIFIRVQKLLSGMRVGEATLAIVSKQLRTSS